MGTAVLEKAHLVGFETRVALGLRLHHHARLPLVVRSERVRRHSALVELALICFLVTQYLRLRFYCEPF